MAREAKLGLVFIGILLTVFCALVIKRLTKHPTLPALDLTASTVKASDAATFSRLPPQPAPATLVTPQDGNNRPPEFAMNTHDTTPITRETTPQKSGSLWERPETRPANTEFTSRENTSAASQPPSLLAESTPVADTNSRYTQTPLPYRSGYSATGDEEHSTSSVTVRPAPSEPAVDPFRVTETKPPADYNVVSESPRSNWQSATPTASNVATTGNTGVNGLRPLPTNTAVTSPTAVFSPAVTASNDRYGSPPPPVPQVSNPVPSATTEFTPRTSPMNEYLPRNNADSDFTSRAMTSAVVPASAVPVGIQRDGDQYAVQPNDSFWIISEKAYGSGGYFKALFELNRKRTKDSENLKVGEVLTVPDEAVLRRMYPDLSPKPRKPTASLQQRMMSASTRLPGGGRVYTVVDGDTLFEIARHELGKPARWGEIYELNRETLGDDLDYLRPGTQLILPAGPTGPADSHNNTATRQPDTLYPR